MYIYYTHHRDGHGKIVLTELKLTSEQKRWNIAFYNSVEKAIFLLIKEKALKEPPIAMRSYDDATCVWTYMEDWGEKVLQRATALASVLGGVIKVEVPDLASIAAAISFDPSKLRASVRPEDFFYNPSGSAAAGPRLSREQLQEKLAALLGTSTAVLAAGTTEERKKLYRKAALLLHPDRNNGDGSKMSELNFLWQLYQA